MFFFFFCQRAFHILLLHFLFYYSYFGFNGTWKKHETISVSLLYIILFQKKRKYSFTLLRLEFLNIEWQQFLYLLVALIFTLFLFTHINTHTHTHTAQYVITMYRFLLLSFSLMNIWHNNNTEWNKVREMGQQILVILWSEEKRILLHCCLNIKWQNKF